MSQTHVETHSHVYFLLYGILSVGNLIISMSFICQGALIWINVETCLFLKHDQDRWGAAADRSDLCL